MSAVLVVAGIFPPGAGTSGVLRPLKFAKYLPEFGWTPHVLTVAESFYQLRDPTLLGDLPSAVVLHRTRAVEGAPMPGGRRLELPAVPDRYIGWAPFAVARGLRVIRQAGIRAIYSTSPPPSAHLVAAALRAWSGVPWVADFRDPWIEEGIHPVPGTWRCRVERAMEQAVLRRADRVVATTAYLRGDLLARHRRLAPDRVHVIHNGYDEEDFRAVPDGVAAPRFELLHAGLVTREFRNPVPLLEALAALIAVGTIRAEDARVTLLGGGPWVRSREFQAETRRLGLDTVVDAAGLVPHGEALRRLAGAAVQLVMQASDDTRSLIPAKTFEYLRIPRPILGLVLDGATADLLKGMPDCHLVRPDDPAGLRRTLAALYRAWRESPWSLPEGRRIRRYERRALTGRLAEILDELAGAGAGRRVA